MNVLRCGKLAAECVSNDHISEKCVFHPLIAKFLAKKDQKVLKFGKIGKKLKSVFERKIFHSFKRHF